jgi:hypothetical protein
MTTRRNNNSPSSTGYEDDDDAGHVNARSARRASLKMSRRGSAGPVLVPELQPQKLSIGIASRKKGGRRASMENTSAGADDDMIHHVRAHRRASFSGPVSPERVPREQRQGPAVGDCTDKQSRRGSASKGGGGAGSLAVATKTRTSGINPDAVKKMSSFGWNGHSQDDNEDEDDESKDALGYAYGYEQQPQQLQKMPRRSSNGSYASRASQRSRRRNSVCIRKDTDPVLMAEIQAGPSLVPDSDLEDDSEDAY